MPVAELSSPGEFALPRFVSVDAAATSAYLRGRLAQLDGQIEEAFAAFQIAASLRPDDVATQRALAQVAVRLGNTQMALRAAEQAAQLAPDDADVRTEYVSALLAAGEFERAVDLLERMLDPAQLDSQVAFTLLSVYLKLERAEQAEALGRSMIEQKPAELPGYLALGSVLEREERLDEAEALYRSAFERVPLDPRLYDSLARLAQRRGDSDGEIEILRNKLDLVPGEPYTLGRLVEIHTLRGDRGALISTIEEVLRYNPDNARGRFQLGLLYLQSGRDDEAVRSLERVSNGPASEFREQARYLLGGLYEQRGETERALRMLQSIDEEAELHDAAQRSLVSVYAQSDRYAEALATLERVIERSDELALQVQRARLLQELDRLDEAVALFDELIRENPDDAGRLHFELGMTYTRAGQEDRALEVMIEALSFGGDDPDVLNYVGYVWADRGIRLDEAESMIRRAVEQRPEDGIIVDSLGWVLYKRGLVQQSAGEQTRAEASFAGAVRELERAQELLEPDDATIARHLGDVYRTLSRFEEAVAAYEHALELGPSEDDASAIRRELESLRRRLEPSRAPGDAD